MFRRNEWPEDLRSGVQDLVIASIDKEVSMLEALIIKAQANGKVRGDINPRTVASVTASVFHGLFVLQLAEVLPEDFINYSDFLFDALSHELEIKK